MKNAFKPTVYGVGFMGVLKDGTTPSHSLYPREYKHWANMLERCYSKRLHKQYPTYKDCTVDEKLHNFSYFLENIHLIDNYEEWKNNVNVRWHLDKDIKNPGNKHYSIENCSFLTVSDNAKERYSRLQGIENYSNNTREVICLETKIIYNSIQEAEKENKCTNVGGCCKGVYKTSGGLHWMYLDEYNLATPEKIQEKINLKREGVAGSKNGNSQSVICLNTNQVFETIKEATHWCKSTGVSNVCRKRKGTAGKHPETGEKLKWMYYDDWLLHHRFRDDKTQQDITDVALQ